MNPYAKYLGPEDHLQKAVLDYIRLQYPTVLVWHTSNEGKRSAFERFKAKWLGLRSGVSDLILIHDKKLLALELKAGKNKPTAAQDDFITEIAHHGFLGAWANGFDAAKKTIDDWVV